MALGGCSFRTCNTVVVEELGACRTDERVAGNIPTDPGTHHNDDGKAADTSRYALSMDPTNAKKYLSIKQQSYVHSHKHGNKI